MRTDIVMIIEWALTNELMIATPIIVTNFEALPGP